MSKSIIYYTDNSLSDRIFYDVQKLISNSGLPIVSVSLQPINFGKNIVLNLPSGIVTMLLQITTALESSTADYVFFCEHDVLYPPSHFEFTPPRNDIYYYNAHVWRWKYPENLAITYDRLICLSGLCANRLLALKHYQARLAKIKELGFKQDSHEPKWARLWGYEPGTKKIKRGGFSDDDFATWMSAEAIIDIRHSKTFSPPKVSLAGFKHLPTGWRQTTLDKIPGWQTYPSLQKVHS